MRIAIDIRGLAKPRQSGVGEYTLELLYAIFKVAAGNDYILFSTGTEIARRHVLDNLSRIDIEKYRARVRHVHHLAPNKKINLAILARQEPRLDELLLKEADFCDLFFFPNLNFISVNSTPSVVAIHDMSWHIFPHFFTAKDRAWHRAVRPERILKHAQAIITPSENTKRDAASLLNIDQEKFYVIPHGINSNIFNPKPLPQDHGIRSQYKLPSRYILFIGTIEPRKNIHTLLDAFDILQNDTQFATRDIHLVIAGGPGWKSSDIIDRFGKNKMVHYLGYIPSEHRPVLYRGAEAFIFPSIYEGFGLPVLEAMSCGVPVIASHTSSIPEITGQAAILINPYNANDIAAALTELFQSEKLRINLIEKGLEQAKQFSWEKTAQKTLEVFNKIQG